LSGSAARPVEHGLTEGFLICGVFTWLAWLVVITLVVPAIVPNALLAPYSITVTHGFGLALLLLIYFLYRRKRIPGSQMLAATPTSWRVWVIGTAAIATIYLLEFAYTKALGICPELFVRQLYVGRSPANIAVLLATIIVLVPIGEELAFRYFLLGAIPYKRGKRWSAAAVLITATVFTAVHMQYQNTATLVLLFLVACVLAMVRIVTGGLLVPIFLHSEAALMALILNEFQ
jgi:membrane protease YdiL (CAAX protease family)